MNQRKLSEIMCVNVKVREKKKGKDFYERIKTFQIKTTLNCPSTLSGKSSLNNTITQIIVQSSYRNV